jgi:hypothetical protein
VVVAHADRDGVGKVVNSGWGPTPGGGPVTYLSVRIESPADDLTRGAQSTTGEESGIDRGGVVETSDQTWGVAAVEPGPTTPANHPTGAANSARAEETCIDRDRVVQALDGSRKAAAYRGAVAEGAEHVVPPADGLAAEPDGASEMRIGADRLRVREALNRRRKRLVAQHGGTELSLLVPSPAKRLPGGFDGAGVRSPRANGTHRAYSRSGGGCTGRCLQAKTAEQAKQKQWSRDSANDPASLIHRQEPIAPRQAMPEEGLEPPTRGL